MAKDLQLTGQNFCNIDCVDKNSIIHPETCVNQVLTGNNNPDQTPQTLSDWVANNPDDVSNPFESFDQKTSLLSWLRTYYDINNTYVLPTATYSDVLSPVLGGIKVNRSYLTLTEGVLSVNTSAVAEALDIPTLDTATFSSQGVVKLANSTALNTPFIDSSINAQVNDSYNYEGHVYAFPLRLDANGRAGIAVPTNLFRQNSSKIVSDWIFDWSKKVTNVNTDVSLSGGTSTNYVLLGNKSLNTNNGELGYDSNGNLATAYGYPRLALVAGSGITLTRYTDKFIQPSDNYWGGNITEIMISSNSSYELPVADADVLGGIKIGFTDASNNENKPVILDENNKAYVNISNDNFKNQEIVEINQVVFDKYTHHFDTYKTKCDLTGDLFTISNVNDFKKVIDNTYTTNLQINTAIEYDWNIVADGTKTIAIIDAISTCAKGYFKLSITQNGIEETHDVGFVIDTPNSDHEMTFAWFSTCQWEVLLYEIETHNCRVYLKAPTDFAGKVKISGKIVLANLGNNIRSLNGTTPVSWTSSTTITNGSPTSLSGSLVTTPKMQSFVIEGVQTELVTVPSGCKIPVDAFITTDETLTVGTYVYDNDVNDAILHSLIYKVKMLEYKVNVLENIAERLNVYFTPQV